MARIRSIKPEFFTNERLSALPASTHLLAAALLTYADDEGYFNANPGLVRAACGPLRDDFAKIPEMLASLLRIDYIRFYDGSNGSRYGHIVEFSKHQRVDHPSASKIKPLLLSPESLAKPREVVAPDQGTGNREQGKDKDSAAARLAGFDEFWKRWPKRVARADAEKAWAKIAPDAKALRRILAAVAEQSRLPDWTKDGGKYIPHPGTWLNGKRWEDEAGAAREASADGMPTLSAAELAS